MTGFVADSKFYQPLRLREAEFEALLPPVLESLAPDWRWVPWKEMLSSNLGRVRPDALLIHRSEPKWWVVEVELSTHHETHFDDQFARISRASFHIGLAESVSRAGGVDRERAEAIIRYGPPSLLCVAEASTRQLANAARVHGFELAVVAALRSREGSYGFAIEQLPAALRAAPPDRVFVLPVSTETFGGRVCATLPRNFPSFDRVTIQFRSALNVHRVVAIGSERAMYLPRELVQADGSVSLVAIDPAVGLFEVVEGNR